MRREDNPCYLCGDRWSECHSNCERYAEFQRMHEVEKQREHEYTFVNMVTKESVYRKKCDMDRHMQVLYGFQKNRKRRRYIGRNGE